MRIAAIADDLTGALETGVQFSRFPGGAAVITDLKNRPTNAGGLIFDTESRHLSDSAAEAAIRMAVLEMDLRSADLVFKKTDSTLRGPIAAELSALAHTMPEHSLVFVPGYPSMGRTVKGGVLYVNGIPVHQTEFGIEDLNPVTESRVSTVLKSHICLPVVSLRPEQLSRPSDSMVWVVDCETDEDVRIAARFIATESPRVIAIGTSLFASSLADAFAENPSHVMTPLERCLVINGSRHPRSLAQIADAKANGWQQIIPHDVEIASLPEGWWILNTDRVYGDGLVRARRVGDAVRRILETTQVEMLCIFGGDTAFGISQALGEPPWWPLGEVMPAVPLSKLEWGNRQLSVITKAGAFGPVDILTQLQSAAKVKN